MPASRAAWATGRKRARDSEMEQFMLRWEKASEAAAKMAISEVWGVGVEVVWERYEVRPRMLGVR